MLRRRPLLVRPTSHCLTVTVECLSVSLSICLSQSCAPSTTGTSCITQRLGDRQSVCLSVLQLCTLPSVLNLPPLVHLCSRPPIVYPTSHALIITVGCLSVCLSVCPTSHCLCNNGRVSVSLTNCLSHSCAAVRCQHVLHHTHL